jgi:hypothetical protein
MHFRLNPDALDRGMSGVIAHAKLFFSSKVKGFPIRSFYESHSIKDQICQLCLLLCSICVEREGNNQTAFFKQACHPK